MGIRILGRDLLEHPTIKSLSAYLASKMKTGSGLDTGRPTNERLARTQGLNGLSRNQEIAVLEQFKKGIITLEEVRDLI